MLSLRMLSGDTVRSAEWSHFELTVTLDGEGIPAIAAAPTVAPFDIAFYMSDNDRLSGDDIDLQYSLSWSASVVLKSGLQAGKPLIMQDLKGMLV